SDKCFVFSSQILRERSLGRAKGPFASAKLRPKGTKSEPYFSHNCAPAARNARSGLAAVIGPACRQVNELLRFWSARFGVRRCVCLRLLEVAKEQLGKRELHTGSVSDGNEGFVGHLVRARLSGRNGNDF